MSSGMERPIPLFTEKLPEDDYVLLQQEGMAWVAAQKGCSDQRLVTIRPLYNVSVSDFTKFCQIRHANIVRPISFYCKEGQCLIVHEYLKSRQPNSAPTDVDSSNTTISQVCLFNAPVCKGD